MGSNLEGEISRLRLLLVAEKAAGAAAIATAEANNIQPAHSRVFKLRSETGPQVRPGDLREKPWNYRTYKSSTCTSSSAPQRTMRSTPGALADRAHTAAEATQAGTNLTRNITRGCDTDSEFSGLGGTNLLFSTLITRRLPRQSPITPGLSGSNFNDRTTQTALDPLAGSRFVPGDNARYRRRPSMHTSGCQRPVSPVFRTDSVSVPSIA
jgi:hypothetical protein